LYHIGTIHLTICAKEIRKYRITWSAQSIGYIINIALTEGQYGFRKNMPYGGKKLQIYL
jgi:hypothetical protein